MNKLTDKIVLEIGLNHLGDQKYLKRYIKELIEIKSKTKISKCTFQFRKDKKETILEKDFFKEQLNLLKKNKFQIGFSIEDLFFCEYLNSFEPDFFKILSWEANNINLIKELIRFEKPIFISLGYLSDIEIEILSNSICALSNKLSFIYTQIEGNVNLINLRSISELQKKTQLEISYGHHVESSEIPLYLSLAYNVNNIFMYVKLDKDKKHNDELNAFYLSDIERIYDNLKKSEMYLGINKKYEN